MSFFWPRFVLGIFRKIRCKEHGIRDSLAYRFRDEALDGMKSGLSGSQKRGTLGAEAEKDRLLKIIGQQAVVIDFQKKISQELSL